MLFVESSRGEFVHNPVIRSTPSLKMPVDFTAYLLSSSPPAFELYSLRDRPGNGLKGGFQSARTLDLVSRNNSTSCQVLPTSVLDSDDDSDDSDTMVLSNPRLSSLDDVTSSVSDLRISNSYPLEFRVTSSCNNKFKKSVSFADEKGYRLTQVRVMSEPSSQPPRVRPEVLSKLTDGASVEATSRHSPPLLLRFSQPASDYLAFRERLERDSVSLENVILKDYTVIGTVKVKNIAFEKKVTVRVTFDGWETNEDIACQFVPQGSSALSCPYDTFSFTIDVPPAFDVTKSVQFCVCYETNEAQFWDSNNGLNYEIRSSKYEKMPSDQTKLESNIFSLGFSETDWSTYSSWNYLDNEVPYY